MWSLSGRAEMGWTEWTEDCYFYVVSPISLCLYIYRYYFDTIINAKVKTNKTEKGLSIDIKKENVPQIVIRAVTQESDIPWSPGTVWNQQKRTAREKGTLPWQKRGCFPGTSIPLWEEN